MRGWFGVALLGFVLAVIGGIGGAILSAVHYDTRTNSAPPWPLAVGQGITAILLITGLIAVLVGLGGVGVRSIRS